MLTRLITQETFDDKKKIRRYNNFVFFSQDFPRERPKLLKPEDEIGRADGSKVSNSSPSHSRFKTKIDQDPEYKSIYLDPTKERPVYHRPPLSLRPSVNSSSRSSIHMRAPSQLDGYHYQRRDSRKTDAPLSEIRSQYVNYGQVPRVESLRMPANLRYLCVYRKILHFY